MIVKFEGEKGMQVETSALLRPRLEGVKCQIKYFT